MENQIFTPDDARRAYMREWRAKNRDHIREYSRQYRIENLKTIKDANERYWKRKADEMNEAARNAAGGSGEHGN